MIVYMLLNTVTEKCYVGATDGTLQARWRRHLKETIAGGSSLGRALRDWPEEFWLLTVLANCCDTEELSKAETAWMSICCSLEPGVGYNESTVPYVIDGKRNGADVLTATVKASSPLAGLTIEQRREYFREAGRRGAAKSRVTPRT